MNESSKKQSSLVAFLVVALLIFSSVLIETKIDLSVLAQLSVKGLFIILIFGLNNFFGGKLTKILFSMWLMSLLVFIFFLSIAIATGVETYYDTTTALKVIYHSKWFEWIQFLLFINLIANIVKYKIYKLEKIGSFIFHVSFLIIIIGAWITRNYSFEGMMQIPEGKAVNYILSSDTYLSIKVDDKEKQYSYDMPLLISEYTSNNFVQAIDFPSKANSIKIVYKDFIPKMLAKDTVEITDNGTTILNIVTVGNNGRKYNYIKKGTVLNDKGLKLAFDIDGGTDAINLISTDSGLVIKSPYDINYVQMSDQSEGVIIKDSIQPFVPRRLYVVGGTQFMFNKIFDNADVITEIQKHHPMGTDNLVVDVIDGNEKKTVYLEGGKGIFPTINAFSLGGLNYRLTFGSKIIQLPFSIFLRDFQLENYPGTQRPSSYASEVTVIDGDKNLDHRIFMNNVLDYKGYRFFQSSFNQGPQGESTILSVNHDYWGTLLTYIGYSLMGLGFILSIFLPGSRFRFFMNKTSEIRKKREAMLKTLVFILGFGLSTTLNAQNAHVNQINSNPVDKVHADKFGHLIIQDYEGRFKPVQTTALEVLKKVSRQETYNGQTPMQVFIGLHTNFNYWYEQPLIYVSGDSTKKVLGVEGKRAKMSDFYTKDSQYKLKPFIDNALAKEKSRQNAFDKNFIKTDERFNVLLGVVMGYYLKIFPNPSDTNNKWVAPAELGELHGEDSVMVNNLLSWYIYSVQKENWKEANNVTGLIDAYQQKEGDAKYLPSEDKIEWEIFYNKANIFKWISIGYILVGLYLLILQFLQIFNPKKSFKYLMIIGTALMFVLFSFHGFGLGLRWYLSGHAPWSNGYEAVVFIGFITVLAGLLFSKQSKIVLGATGILAWLMLFVANLNNMDPQITPLVPVLKSYWLMIHVAVITGSYGFLGVSAILSVINWFMDIFKTSDNKKQINLTKKELRYINEMVMTIGLFMLTIGTFLGGVWANESWGRYWGWDAKETWALASVLVYTIILHLRFVPGMKSDFTFNSFAFWGYSSIIMTFYGVNYYLSGLHSYATGEPVPIPTWVPITIIVFVIINILAYVRGKRV
jgi:cytochrome c-type biogenesis protein CcsB